MNFASTPLPAALRIMQVFPAIVDHAAGAARAWAEKATTMAKVTIIAWRMTNLARETCPCDQKSLVG
jgi:hypothetical protein